MNMGVAGSLVMDGKVGAHPLVHKVVLHIGPDKGKLPVPWDSSRGQGRFDLAGKLAVPGFLDLARHCSRGWSGLQTLAGRGREGDDFRMDNAAFPGVIMGQAVPFIRQFGSASVGGCGNSGTALAALDDTDGDMTEIYGWHLLSAGIFQATWSRTDAKRGVWLRGAHKGFGGV